MDEDKVTVGWTADYPDGHFEVRELELTRAELERLGGIEGIVALGWPDNPLK